MRKTKIISILMVAIMLLAIIVPTTKVLATDDSTAHYSIY